MTTNNTIIFETPYTSDVEFGNAFDTSGHRIVNAEILGSQDRFIKVFLVRDGDTYGIATFNDRKGLYHCTDAMTLGAVFSGRKFTEQDLARHLGFPSEVFVPAVQ